MDVEGTPLRASLPRHRHAQHAGGLVVGGDGDGEGDGDDDGGGDGGGGGRAASVVGIPKISRYTNFFQKSVSLEAKGCAFREGTRISS